MHGRHASLCTSAGSLSPTFPPCFLFHFLFSPLVSPPLCGQALERQKEYFGCIRNERDELRDELADIKGKSKNGEVGYLGTFWHTAGLQE